MGDGTLSGAALIAEVADLVRGGFLEPNQIAAPIISAENKIDQMNVHSATLDYPYLA
jgi:hypothetical protein